MKIQGMNLQQLALIYHKNSLISSGEYNVRARKSRTRFFAARSTWQESSIIRLLSQLLSVAIPVHPGLGVPITEGILYFRSPHVNLIVLVPKSIPTALVIGAIGIIFHYGNLL